MAEQILSHLSSVIPQLCFRWFAGNEMRNTKHCDLVTYGGVISKHAGAASAAVLRNNST